MVMLLGFNRISWGYSWGAVGVMTGYGHANNPGKLGYNITL